MKARDRIAQCFSKNLSLGQKALIPYVVAGDPDLHTTLAILHQLVKSGADMIELGMPFSDPVADGPIIQAAHQRALHAAATLEGVFALVQEFRRQNQHTPIILMTYLNPIEAMGHTQAIKAMYTAGIDGVLIVDMPPEEGESIEGDLQQYDIKPIFLISPTTSEARMQYISKQAEGYLYYVSIKGITGGKIAKAHSIAKDIEKIRQYSRLPIAIGFGINNAETAKHMSQFADGIIVGSAYVEKIAKYQQQAEKAKNNPKNHLLLEQLGQFTHALKRSLLHHTTNKGEM